LKDLLHFKDFVNEINAENGRVYKQSVLRKYKNDAVVKQFLKFAFDPFEIFGLGEKKLNKKLSECEEAMNFGVIELFHYLRKYNTGTDYQAACAQTVLNKVLSLDSEAAELLKAIICKDLTLGVNAKLINSEIPGCIRTFSVQLAQKYFENPAKLENKEFVITEKLDGIRVIAIRDESGNVNFYSRVGQPITGLVELEEEMRRLPLNIALDGELTISNYRDMSSGDAYKATTKIVRTKDTEKRGLTMRVFDGMLATEFKAQHCTSPYSLRRSLIEELCASCTHLEVLPVLYRGTDTSKITELLDTVVDAGGEGVMCNIVDATYSFGRTWDLQKVKRMSDVDLRVVGCEKGSGRLADTLGALIVSFKGNEVKVGSGFTDEQRAMIWADRENIIGKICCVKYFEISKATTGTSAGKESLRFPIFVDFRDDKLEPDF
jgi:DNA ligase-1